MIQMNTAPRGAFLRFNFYPVKQSAGQMPQPQSMGASVGAHSTPISVALLTDTSLYGYGTSTWVSSCAFGPGLLLFVRVGTLSALIYFV